MASKVNGKRMEEGIESIEENGRMKRVNRIEWKKGWRR